MFSQNIPLTKYNILEYLENNFTNWTSGNEKINSFIKERQLKINDYDDIVLEWISYNQFNEIKETGKNGLITVYSAIWRDGPLHKKNNRSNYTRDSNKTAKKYSTNYKAFQVLYGISQSPDTGSYILVVTCSSGNEKIDGFIQERQLKIDNYNDIVLEWISYNQFNEIKETGKNGLITVYSAIWKDGPLYKKYGFYGFEDYTRDSNKEVTLKCLHSSQESIDSLINEAKKYPIKYKALKVVYGISQNPDTGDYILVLNWTSGNENIDDFIQEKQLKINNFDDIVLEWIPYHQFNEIKEIGKNSLITVYSAIWKDGPLYKKYEWSNYTRDSNKEVTLKCLHNLQESIDSLINKAKKYPIKHKSFQVLYGISQNPDTGNYILVLIWTSGNEKIDNFIQERQLKITNNNDDIVLEWIPYNQFNEIMETGKNNLITVYSAIWKDGPLYKLNDYYVNANINYTRDSNKKVFLKYLHNSLESIDSLINEAKKYPIKHKTFHEIGKGGFSTVYLAEWKNGPLEYDVDKEIYNRNPNKVIALKCLHNSQSITDKFLNEVKEYSINKSSNILNIYGISQNPDTKEYIMVLQYAKEGNFNHWINKNYEYFNWENKISALLNIINGLKEIHQRNLVHRDFHTGNILLFFDFINNFSNCVLISDMGLCGEVDNIDKTKIYGIMPYVAPEVLRGKPYTQAADIYSFGMIMYFVATGRQPFGNRAHDYDLALDICKGIRPEISEPEAPRYYIDLMKKCWNLDKNNRPDIFEVDKFITSFNELYVEDLFIVGNEEIEIQFKEAEEYRKANLSSTENHQIVTHPQAIYTSRLHNPITQDLPKNDDDYNSQCLDQVI
ncbi:unnamed protein product [Rhizophagus irregularis]|nr:unnamed protein product [Rhizophagus irregularis]